MQHPAQQSQLGKQSHYPALYDASVLFAIEREVKWSELGLKNSNLPWQGQDIWTAYELSWLLPAGKPVVAMAEIRVPADSPNIIESKSFKLYLNSFNQSCFADAAEVSAIMRRDLSAIAGADVSVRILEVAEAAKEGLSQLPGACIDDLDVAVSTYAGADPALLAAVPEAHHEQQLHSHLLRSLCPVTRQPDWGSVAVEYSGERRLQPETFLQYLVSFREHEDFHEQCVERIFLDLYRLLEPDSLSVQARYLRRGGLDINPCRSTHERSWDNLRLARQ